MKKLFFALQFPLFVAVNFFVLVAIFEIAASRRTSDIFRKTTPKYNGTEEFDPSLVRLDNLKKVGNYCDSLYSISTNGIKQQSQESYVQTVSSVIRKRFYHGYSNFGLSNNLVAMLLSPITGKNSNAIVLPNEILKYPYAACSQQSIVTIDLLKSKGISTRAIRFTGERNGHFAFEAFYDDSWHFFDPNLEPDQSVLDKYNRPGIAFLASHKEVLLSAYRHLPKDMVLDIFTHYKYGKANAAPAPWATLYQQVTKVLSYTLWMFFLMAFIMVRRKYLRLSNIINVRNSRVFIPQLQSGTSPTYYLGY